MAHLVAIADITKRCLRHPAALKGGTQIIGRLTAPRAERQIGVRIEVPLVRDCARVTNGNATHDESPRQ
jgi:hypothetical protein